MSVLLFLEEWKSPYVWHSWLDKWCNQWKQSFLIVNVIFCWLISCLFIRVSSLVAVIVGKANVRVLLSDGLELTSCFHQACLCDPVCAASQQLNLSLRVFILVTCSDCYLSISYFFPWFLWLFSVGYVVKCFCHLSILRVFIVDISHFQVFHFDNWLNVLCCSLSDLLSGSICSV